MYDEGILQRSLLKGRLAVHSACCTYCRNNLNGLDHKNMGCLVFINILNYTELQTRVISVIIVHHLCLFSLKQINKIFNI